MTKKFWLALTAPSILVVLALWLPFGFTLSGLIEEWDVLGLFTIHGLFFAADATSPMAAHSLRPLTILPHAIAFYIDPNSFDYWHLLLILALVIKGGASTYLAWKITRSFGWAMVMGVLVLVYPADTMQLSFRSLHINFALALLLLAASLQVSAYDNERRSSACCLGIGAAGLLLLSVSMYEAALALAPLPYLVIFSRDGFRETWKRLCTRPELVLTWLTGAGLFIAYVCLVISQKTSYQSNISGDRAFISILYNSFPKLWSVGVIRGLLGGWFDALQIFLTEFSKYTYLIFVVLISIFFIQSQTKKTCRLDFYGSGQFSLGRLQLLQFSVSAMLILILGYVPYLFSNAHLVISQRTFLFSTLGAAMVWLAFLIFLSKYSKWLARISVTALLLLGFGAQLFQFHHYSQISKTQRQLLRSIVENFDGNLGSKTLVIFDQSNRLSHTWMLRDNLRWALSYLYDRPIKSVEICLMPDGEWQRPDSLARMGKCFDGKDNWTFQGSEPVTGPGLTSASVAPNLTIPKEEAVTLTINADGSISHQPVLNAYRESLQHGTNFEAIRYRHILARDPWALEFKQFQNEEILDSFTWDFGRWWSLEIPTRGSGWREAEWEVNHFIHKASAWKSQTQSRLVFDFTPANKIYQATGQFDLIVNQPIRESLQIKINGKTIRYTWTDTNRFEASVPAGLMVSGTNTIELNSETDSTYYGLSAKLDWLKISPK